MKIFPSEKFEIDAEMTSEQVIRRLEEVTKIEKYVSIPKNKNIFDSLLVTENAEDYADTETKIFRGIIDKEEFFICRNVQLMGYREPLEIHGKVRQENNISIVSIEMKMGLIRKAAFCISSLILFAVMMVLFIVSLKEPPALIASTIGLVLSPFTIIMMHYYFRADVQATKPILLRILGETKTIDFSQPK